MYLAFDKHARVAESARGFGVHSDREYLSGARERENRLHTELGNAVGRRRRTIVKRNTLYVAPRRTAVRKFVLLSFRWWRWVRHRLYPCLEGMDYLSRVPMYLVPVYIFPTRRAMKILLALGRLPRRLRPRVVSVLSPRSVPDRRGGRTCSAVTRPAGYSSIPVT